MSETREQAGSSSTTCSDARCNASDARKEADRYAVHWQGRGADGKRLASGMYLCRFLAEGEVVATRKLNLVR